MKKKNKTMIFAFSDIYSNEEMLFPDQVERELILGLASYLHSKGVVRFTERKLPKNIGNEVTASITVEITEEIKD